MTRRLFALLPFVVVLGAAHADVAGTGPSADEANVFGTIAFIALFIAFCGGFFWFVWKNERKAKQKKGADASEP